MNGPVLPALMSLAARVVLAVLMLALVAAIASGSHSTQLRPTAEASISAAPQLPTGELLPAITGAPAVTSAGSLAYADPGFGRWYLALPEPIGTVAVVCGPAACVTRTSTDYGPDQRKHPERIADLSARDFSRVCGVPLSFGLCPGTYTILSRPRATLPPTDQ